MSHQEQLRSRDRRSGLVILIILLQNREDVGFDDCYI